MHSQLTFRFFEDRDREACLGILDSNRPDYFSHEDAREYSAFLDSIPGVYFVGELAEQIVACGGWAVETNGIVSLTWGMVHRRHHGSGIGSALLKHRIQHARADREEPVFQLKTIPAVTAFFERVGFKTEAVVIDGFGPGMDEVTMQLRG